MTVPGVPPPRPAAEDLGGLMRLADFRKDHPPPDAVIWRAESGAGWEAKVRLPGDAPGLYGGHFQPRPLGDLLDALEEELGGGPEPPDSS